MTDLQKIFADALASKPQSEPLTYRQAKLIIWNPDAYRSAKVREAAVFILGTINARREDVDQATNLV